MPALPGCRNETHRASPQTGQWCSPTFLRRSCPHYRWSFPEQEPGSDRVCGSVRTAGQWRWDCRKSCRNGLRWSALRSVIFWNLRRGQPGMTCRRQNCKIRGSVFRKSHRSSGSLSDCPGPPLRNCTPGPDHGTVSPQQPPPPAVLPAPSPSDIRRSSAGRPDWPYRRLLRGSRSCRPRPSEAGAWYREIPRLYGP